MTQLDERPVVLGREEPRLWTPPLRELTPETSAGFSAVQFAEEILGMTLLPWQRWWLIHALELRSDGKFRFRTVLTLVARQNGKALDCSVQVLTISGWSTMGDLRVGDEVFHPDGHPVRVTEVHPVMDDHPCFRVTTTDGRSIVADGEHLWTVQDRRRVTKRGRRGERPVSTYEWETLTTEQLLERGLLRQDCVKADGRRHRDYAYRLPVQHAIESKPVDLPVDPYLLGAWLGDGHKRSSALSVGDGDLVEMVSLIEAAGAETFNVRRDKTAWRVPFRVLAGRHDGFQSRLMRLGLWGDKQIPDVYLAAGTEQRLALLQGLMDTDGSIEKRRGQAEFCSTNRNLADGVLYLARSLGWRATIKESAATLNGREVSRRWRVMWTPTQDDPSPFRLRRKAERVQASNARGGELRAVSIASIERVGSRPVRCIKVDREDGLFLAGRDLIPTHNTTICKILALWFLYVRGSKLVLGAAQDLKIARESWQGAVDLAQGSPELCDEIASVRYANGEQCLTLTGSPKEPGGRYMITAATRSAGRGLPVDGLLLLDELREQRDWSAWGALSKTTMAQRSPLTVGISNQGDDESVVLNGLRDAALKGGDDTLGCFEWSAPPSCRLDDVEAWAMANPGLGRTITDIAIRSALATDPASTFKTEVLCQRVDALDAAIDPQGWAACADSELTLEPVRRQVVVAVEVAYDDGHVTAVMAAPLDDGRIGVEVLDFWVSTAAARPALREMFSQLKPRAVGWFAQGPTTVLGPDLQVLHDEDVIGQKMALFEDERRPEAPGLVKLEPVPACEGLADLVDNRQLVHPDDPLLNAHISASIRKDQGDGWRFARRGAGRIDAAYAAAGAIYLARTVPPVGDYDPLDSVY